MRAGRKIAVVGGGVAGMVSAWLLSRKHTVTLFEKNAYVGGHTNTVTLEDGPDAGLAVDTGFIVCNDRTYPNFHRFLGQLGVSVRNADMSFGYYDEVSGLQYAGTSFNGLFAQRRRLVEPRFLGMLTELSRFHRAGARALADGSAEGRSLGTWLENEGFRGWVLEHYIVPMGAAIWSAPFEKILSFPAQTYLRFFSNHGLLTLTEMPQWQTVIGGSHSYVKTFLQRFQGSVVKGTPIRGVRRTPEGVSLALPDGSRQTFDAVVLAGHADESLKLLEDPSDDEKRLLGPWRYQANRTVLHWDTSLLPPRRAAWASWNYLRKKGSDGKENVTVSYHMNRLMGLQAQRDYCVTLNLDDRIDAKKVVKVIDYTHPEYSAEAVATQTELPKLNGQRNSYFAGSYFRYGFHEDAVLSATLVGQAFGEQPVSPETLVREASDALRVDPASSGHGIYVGRVMHQRRGPQDHRFEYPLFYMALDLDTLAAKSRELRPLFGYNQAAVLSLWDKDYLKGEGSLREKVNAFLREKGLLEQVSRVTLLTVPRYFGYVFNPVSFYYAFRADGSLAAALAEVNNTFGEKHLYLLDEPKPGPEGSQARYTVPKDFHVSPFYDRSGDYDFHFGPLGEKLDVRINILRDGQPVFVSRLWGTRKKLSGRELLTTLAAYPLSAALAMPRILWQAAQLRFRKRLPVYTKPYADSKMTLIPEAAGPWRGFQRDLVFRYFKQLRKGALTLTLPDRSVHRFGGVEAGTQAFITVGNWAFFRRIVASGDIGFGESFQEGEWTTPDLVAVIQVLGDNLEHADDTRLSFAGLGRALNRWRHLGRANTLLGSKQNIEAHYDLSNAMYERFLDPSMMYSCALFEDLEKADAEDLQAAQKRKLHSLLKPLNLKPGQQLLEIGSGWGAMAILAAKEYGVKVTSLTLSKEQLKEAKTRAKAAGLDSRITFEIRDYRQIEGQFDAIVSCEMLEAVGHENYGAYFKALDRALKPGGRASIQVITLPDQCYHAYRQGVDWIQKHIFPGAVCPSLEALSAAWTRHSRLGLVSHRDIGLHYAPTLRRWRKAFLEQGPAIRELGFDDKFLRTWEYYFAYCEAGFSRRLLGNLQLVLARSGESLS
jgi:cyclopropane-fatty-acyl-phospholipid synthase